MGRQRTSLGASASACRSRVMALSVGPPRASACHVNAVVGTVCDDWNASRAYSTCCFSRGRSGRVMGDAQSEGLT